MLLLYKLFGKPVLSVLNDLIQHFHVLNDLVQHFQYFPAPSATAQCHHSFFKQVLL